MIQLKHFRLTIGAFAISMSFNSWSLAGDQVGTLTQVQGTVKLFTNPSKTLQEKQGAPHPLFEGEYFLVRDAQSGDQLNKGEIVRTAPGAKARVIYENGDQIHVGSATAYRVTWDQDNSKGQVQIDLTYGRLRGIMESGGPRSRLKIRTRTAVMGVRGTDFFVAQGGSDASTEVTIIRGSVEVTPVQLKKPMAEKSQTVEPRIVKAGYSAEISPSSVSQTPGTPLTLAKIELRKTTQEEFAGIQKSSHLDPQQVQVTENVETKKNMDALEKKAVQVVFKDIEKHDQILFASLGKDAINTAHVEDLNQAAIQHLAKEAPKAPPKRKPFQTELEDLDDGAYKKYFKTIE